MKINEDKLLYVLYGLFLTVFSGSFFYNVWCFATNDFLLSI